MLTIDEILRIVNLADPNELIPWQAFLAARLGVVTIEDIEWAKQLITT